MNQPKLKSLFLTTVLLSSITVSSGTRGELEAQNRIVVIQSDEIQMHRAAAIEIFTEYDVPASELKAAADSIVLDPTGLSYCNRLMRSSITTPSPSDPGGFVTHNDKKYEAPVRIFIELLAQLGIHKPTRTWNLIDTLNTPSLRATAPWLPHNDSMPIVEWVLEQTHSIMEALGEPDRVAPGITIRGGVSVLKDKETARSIIRNLVFFKYSTAGASPERIQLEASNNVTKVVTDPVTQMGFAIVGTNSEARKMYISLCAKVLMSNQPLTESGCKNLARQAKATFSERL